MLQYRIMLRVALADCCGKFRESSATSWTGLT